MRRSAIVAILSAAAVMVGVLVAYNRSDWFYGIVKGQPAPLPEVTVFGG